MEAGGGRGLRVGRAGGRGRGLLSGVGGRGGQVFAAGNGGRGRRVFAAGNGGRGGRGFAAGQGLLRGDGPGPDLLFLNPNTHPPVISKEDADAINLERLQKIPGIHRDDMVRLYKVPVGLLGQGDRIDTKNTNLAEKLTCIVRNRRVVLFEAAEGRGASSASNTAKLRCIAQYKKAANMVMDIDLMSGRAMRVPETYAAEAVLPSTYSQKAKRKGKLK